MGKATGRSGYGWFSLFVRCRVWQGLLYREPNAFFLVTCPGRRRQRRPRPSPPYLPELGHAHEIEAVFSTLIMNAPMMVHNRAHAAHQTGTANHYRRNGFQLITHAYGWLA